MSASSPDVTLAALKLRRGTRLIYECDLNISWLHEVRIEENRLDAASDKSYPTCTAGDGNCPPEDCGGPQGYLAGLDNNSSWEAFDDLHTMADILREVYWRTVRTLCSAQCCSRRTVIELVGCLRPSWPACLIRRPLDG